MSDSLGPTPRPAEQSAQRNREQADFEMAFFGRILDRHPSYVEVLQRQAELLSGLGRRGEALACDAKLVELLPSDPEMRYNLACSLAALGRSEEAIAMLSAALELGYRDFDHLESDPDLDSLRETAGYQALLKLHGSDAVE